MALLKRIGNILKAKANRAVEAAEMQDPVGVIKSQIHEAQEQLKEFENAVHTYGAEKVRLEKKVVELKEQARKSGKSAETALKEGNEDLAVKLLQRQAETEAELETTKKNLKTTEVGFEQMKRKMGDRKKYVEDGQRKIGSLEARQKAAQANLKMRDTMAKFEGNGSAFDQIGIFEDKIEELENKASVADEIELEEKGEDLDAQVEALEAKSAVEDRLAALKAKIS